MSIAYISTYIELGANEHCIHQYLYWVGFQQALQTSVLIMSWVPMSIANISTYELGANEHCIHQKCR